MNGPRYLARWVEADLTDRMVFVGGPRQVGKTTFALSLLPGTADESSPAYLNWDALADREAILAGRIPAGQRRIVFDEIHKYARWRNLVKGLFDVLRDNQPEFAVECKSGERGAAPACGYFRARTPISRFYQVHLGTLDHGDARTNTRVLPFSAFCRELNLP